MSEATIVHGAPFSVNETRPQCVPYEYKIKAPNVLKNELKLFRVHDGYHGLYIDEKRGTIDLPDDAHKLAENLVRDVMVAQIEADHEGKPCFFWLPGHVTELELKETDKYKPTLDKNLKFQEVWFHRLVASADSIWARTHQMIAISDLHRTAALFLGFQREWLDTSPGAMKQCPACYTLIRSQAAVCYACKAIVDVEKAKEFKFAG